MTNNSYFDINFSNSSRGFDDVLYNQKFDVVKGQNMSVFIFISITRR